VETRDVLIGLSFYQYFSRGLDEWLTALLQKADEWWR